VQTCQQFDKTIDHIISACPILAKEQYIKRHDRVCTQLHFNICKETGVQLDKKHWYEHLPKSVETSQGGKVTILWSQQVQTDRTIPSNKPDIIIHVNQKGTCMLIDVAISGERNVIKKETEKILKYKDLTIEIQRMWNVKTKTSNNRGDWDYFKVIQKIRAQHTRKLKSRNSRKQPYWALHTYFGKYLCKSTIDSTLKLTILSTMNSNNRIAATLYSLRT